MIFNIQNNHLIFEIEFLMTLIMYENISINTKNNWQFYTTLSLEKKQATFREKVCVCAVWPKKFEEAGSG